MRNVNLDTRWQIVLPNTSGFFGLESVSDNVVSCDRRISYKCLQTRKTRKVLGLNCAQIAVFVRYVKKKGLKRLISCENSGFSCLVALRSCVSHPLPGGGFVGWQCGKGGWGGVRPSVGDLFLRRRQKRKRWQQRRWRRPRNGGWLPVENHQAKAVRATRKLLFIGLEGLRIFSPRIHQTLSIKHRNRSAFAP